MDSRKRTNANSLPQDRQNLSEELTPEPMPPDIKIIEASCALADNRTSDNSKWTNIIKEPIEVAKGSEIKILSSFIDMRGISQEIIQFQSFGPQQDNGHNLLVQHYTTNDGYNNKTTSYDYLSSYEQFYPLDPGEGYDLTPLGTYKPTVASSNSTNSCFDAEFAVLANGIRPHNIEIVNGGTNYENGAQFVIESGGSTFGGDYQGRVMTDDNGSVIKIFMTRNVSSNTPANPNTLVFTNTIGTGLQVNITYTTGGLYWAGTMTGNDGDASRGAGFKTGDLIYIEDNKSGTISPENQAIFRLGMPYFGDGSITGSQHFDQGYNYERSPIYRWAQTFTLNQNYVYGGNTGERSFQSHGQEIIIEDENSHQLNDACLSGQGIIMNKEDEFASGIYHTKNNDDEFFINAPVMWFDENGTTGQFALTANDENGFTFQAPLFQTETINGKVVNGSLANIMPKGSVWQFQFEYENISNPTSQNLIDLHEQLGQYYSMPFRITNNNPRDSSVSIASSVLPYQGQLTELVVGSQRSGANTFPANQAVDIPVVFNAAEDNGPPPTQLPVVIFFTDGNGQFDGSYGFRADIPGEGLRRGMTFSINQNPAQGGWPGAQERFYIKQVDSTNGWELPTSRDLNFTNIALNVVTGGNPESIRMYLVPLPNHSKFVDSSNSPDDSIEENYGNRIGFRPYKNPPTIGSNFPCTIESSIIQPNSASSDSTIGYTSYASNGLYKPAGELDSTNPYFTPKQGALTNHDTEIQLQILDNNENLQSFDVKYGQDPSQDVFIPYGNTADDQSLFYDAGSFNWQFRIHQANWAALGKTIADLPLFTYLVLQGSDQQHECHMQTAGIIADDGTYWTIGCITPDVEYNNQNTIFMSAASQAYLALPTPKLYAGIIDPTTNNLNGRGYTEVYMIYSPDLKNNATQLTCKWNNMTGGMAYSGMANFFNTNDPNYNLMINEPLIKNNSISLRNSYNLGGFYFLTHFTGLLTTQEGQSIDYNLSSVGDNVYNQGYDYWLFAQIPEIHYNWRSNYQIPTTYNLMQSFTNITSLWDYYKLYRQKSFLIEKNFCVASDISGLWTRSAHALTGAIDMTSGAEYVSAKESGILQNEFITPVYGANNLILPTGEYEKDTTLYPDSGGLEPGHCVGINYLTNNLRWLSGSLMHALPTDEDGNTFYYVFFRTPWTIYRGYDPLKANGGNPDRTALETVNEDAYKIGNANAIGSTTKKALNGDTMLQTTNTDPPANPPLPDNKGYELGTPGGVSVGGTPVRFGERGYYPIYYLDRNLASQYPKAKISQYVGSQNLTLAFATDISTFTFQYLHSPYTSPYVDGVGGTNSVRVFFGNRKAGIFNHETLGGVVVINYARPDFPPNTFTYTEITNNPRFNSSFQYGINPLTSVGYVGRQFLNKLGFTDTNIGIINGQINPSNTELNYTLTPYTRNITELMDGNPGTGYSIQSYDTEFYGTTGTDLDSSDSILSEIPAPESNAGLESYNQLQIPNVGSSNPILRKFGDMIYYPYSLNTDTNSFNTEVALVRFDNASSTYGAVGGLLLSNSNRGMGLPNTVGSTFICDQNTIPRTLNPDCELYLAYTVACGSSLKRASLLPVRLTNAYLLILSSLMKEPNVYMPASGFVNAMSIVNKTFLQGDFILSQGQTAFYAKESFILSQIETEIKDTAFGAPSTLGVNSSVIYQITNYNPQPKKQLPTIEQMQDQDYEIMRMMNSHIEYLQGRNQNSPLNALQSDLYNIGINLVYPNKNSVDVVSAIRNQINAHDLATLTPSERTQFLRTPEGQILLQNVGDIAVINQQLNNVAQAQNDVDGEYGGILGEQRLEAISRTAEREVKAREAAIKDRTPLIYFQPSEPIGEQIPPVSSADDLQIEEINPKAFRAAIPYRYASYLDYKDDAMRRLQTPKSFVEYQQFQYGNVIQPNKPVKDIDPQFLADLEKREGPDGQEFYNLAVESMDLLTSMQAKRNPYFAAYSQKPSYARGQIGNPQYDREVEAFRDEIDRGTADLTHLQREILGDLAKPIHESVGSARQLTIDKYRRAYPRNTELIKNQVVFRTEEQRDEAEAKMKEFADELKALKPGRGRPSKQVLERRKAIYAEQKAYIDSLTKGELGESLATPDVLYRVESRAQENLLGGLKKSFSQEEERRAANQRRREEDDEGIEPTAAGRGGRSPRKDIAVRQQLYRQLADARDEAMVRMAEGISKQESQSRKPRTVTIPARPNVPGEQPLEVPLTDTSQDTFLYRATRVPDGGYYKEPDPDDEYDSEEGPQGTFKSPLEIGVVGTKRQIQNKIFGDDSVFAGKTPEAAQRFIYEMVSNKARRGTWEILKMNVKGLDTVSFPELGKEKASQITERYRPIMRKTSDKLQEAWKKYSDHYAETIAGPSGNLEHIIRGPISPDRISLYSRQTYKTPPTSNPEYQRVQENMRQAQSLKQQAETIQMDVNEE